MTASMRHATRGALDAPDFAPRVAQVLAGLVESGAFDGDERRHHERAGAPRPLGRGEGCFTRRRRFQRRALEIAAPQRQLGEMRMEM